MFADCRGKRFASSRNTNRSDASEQSVFHEKGEWKGTPKFQTVYAAPILRWAKLYPAEAVKGKQQIQDIFRSLRKALETKE